ncbi:MAG: hypothetical protein WDM91_02370 [Rhizomicrobium sp.]
MSPIVYFSTIGLLLGTIVIVFAMKYISAARVAQARIAGDDAAAVLGGIRADLSEIKTRLAVVEKILKEVE